MTTTIIITFCSLLLIAYFFDLTSSRSRIPSVVLLLLLGWLVHRLTDFLFIQLPDFSTILPVLATTGLVLIVLEGSLELELNRSKLGLIAKSFFGALFSLLALSFLFAYVFQYFTGAPLRTTLINAIPLCVISSAIAIPSVRNLGKEGREFVIYESSLSDILGVIFFNFMLRSEEYGVHAFTHFGLQILTITAISFIATIGLSFLLSKIEHQIKFVPIILLVILIYSVSYIYHLPALVFILLFGLSIGNLDEFRHHRWIQRFKPDVLDREVRKFHELTIEAAFLVRALFFLLFGYLLETAEIINWHTLPWSLGVVGAIFVLRAIQLKVSRLPLLPLLFVAPRGLITILLFLNIAPGLHISIVNNSLIIQVILLSALLMMFGLMVSSKGKEPAGGVVGLDSPAVLPEAEAPAESGSSEPERNISADRDVAQQTAEADTREEPTP